MDARLLAGQLLARLQTGTAPLSLREFSERVYLRYQHAPHLGLLDEVLTQVTQYVASRGAQGVGRVIIELPPRHGKTQKVSRIFPAWHLGVLPDSRVMLVCYAIGLANSG